MFEFHVMKLLVHTLLLALAATGATALVIDLSAVVLERQALGAVNRTYVCQENTFGGCCKGFNEIGYGTGCSNATLIKADVGGSTFGSRNEYGCAIDASTKHIGSQGCLCCKYQPSYNSTTYNWDKVMVCSVPDLSPV